MEVQVVNRDTFFVEPMPPFRLDLTVWVLRRRPENSMDRWDQQVYRRVLVLDGVPVEIAVSQVGTADAPRLEVETIGDDQRQRCVRGLPPTLTGCSAFART